MSTINLSRLVTSSITSNLFKKNISYPSFSPFKMLNKRVFCAWRIFENNNSFRAMIQLFEFFVTKFKTRLFRQELPSAIAQRNLGATFGKKRIKYAPSQLIYLIKFTRCAGAKSWGTLEECTPRLAITIFRSSSFASSSRSKWWSTCSNTIKKLWKALDR